jgi:hypothetical protein
MVYTPSIERKRKINVPQHVEKKKVSTPSIAEKIKKINVSTAAIV